MDGQRAGLDEIRGFHAKLMADASRSRDPRLERIFEPSRAEAFFPPGPWKIQLAGSYGTSRPSADPAYLYQNTLVALDADKGIYGTPFFHAAWDRRHCAATRRNHCAHRCWHRYYSAMVDAGTRRWLSKRIRDRRRACRRGPTQPCAVRKCLGNRGQCRFASAAAFRPDLRQRWRSCASTAVVPASFAPWGPNDFSLAAVRDSWGVGSLATRSALGFELKLLMPAWFIPCIGASEGVAGSTPY